eukprot:SM000020S06023  [mRNA]  locus=s20:498946:500213:+ [translate_table: standard]
MPRHHHELPSISALSRQAVRAGTLQGLRRSLAAHRSKKGGHHPSPPPPQKSGKAIARPKHGKKRSPPPSTKLRASPPPPVFRLSPPPATTTGATLSPPPAPPRLPPSPPPRSPSPPPPGPTASPGNYEVVAATNDDIAKLLDSSNSARSALYGPGAPLAWSLDLTAVAQQWVDELMPAACAKGYTQFANLGVHHKLDNMYGENLFWGYWYGGGDYYSLADANNDWLGEAHNYNYAPNDCAADQECGHYTQIIWKGSTQVGCAMAKCKFAQTPAYSFKLIACEYNPPGNWIGEKPY